MDNYDYGTCELNMKFPWNKVDIVENAYKEENYYVKYTGYKNGRAIVFFSSNGLYCPNTEDAFYNAIVKNNKFEWQNVASNRIVNNYYEKIIFMRDIYKQWYITGINERVNTVAKMLDLLQAELSGYKYVVTCGNSSGGYAAILFGCCLGAQRIFSFSGQVNLYAEWGDVPFIEKYRENDIYNKFFDLRHFVNGNEDRIYYFYPGLSKVDLVHEKMLRDGQVHKMRFDSDKHGVTVRGACLPYIITSEECYLKSLFSRYSGKLVNAKTFMKEVVPFASRVLYYANTFWDRMKHS